MEEATLARIAACYWMLDGCRVGFSPPLREKADAGGLNPTPQASSPRFDALAAEVTQRNAHAGDFYSELAQMLEVRNRHAAAERYFREAIRLLPRQPEPYAELGLLLMRMGREADARKLLQEAFDADPFHVRVKNSLDVLDVVDAMQTRTTPHFVIKYDKADARLVPYLARHLETVYGEIRQQFGYEPPDKTLVEIFNECRANRATPGSARMIGLPFLETVAASTGQIVAMVSPGETQTHAAFAWARTLKHEMTHVFNLQQTGFNIPHWFTEGIAVYNEQIPRPYRWTLLLRRRAAAGTLMDLETVNAGFARAMSGDECQLAYCQSEVDVEYMVARGGGEAIKKMVLAYAENPATDVAIRKVFGMSQAEFERGYTAFLRKQIDTTPVLEAADSEHFDELEKAHRRQPKDAAIAARLALAYFQRGAKKEAAELVAETLNLKPKQQLATYVLVKLQKAGTPQEAMARLEDCLDRKAPEPLLLNLLAAMKLKAKTFDEAAELYALGERLDPANPQWTAARAACLFGGRSEAEPRAGLGPLCPNRSRRSALAKEVGRTGPGAARTGRRPELGHGGPGDSG